MGQQGENSGAAAYSHITPLLDALSADPQKAEYYVGLLKPLRRYDREHHGDLVTTLAAYLRHGGNATPGLTQQKAHVLPRNPIFFQSSANPVESSVLLNHESPEFIQFVNPGDLRVAEKACGLCHEKIIGHVQNSMMNHGAMLWGAALYNNGGVPFKDYKYGQAYGADGVPLRVGD